MATEFATNINVRMSHFPLDVYIWNLRLELGHQLKPQPVRTTEFAPAIADNPEAGAKQAPVQGYGTPAVALPWKTGRFSGQDFTLQPNGVQKSPRGQDVAPDRAAPRSRWQLARALQRQNPRLPRLLKAFAVSMAWGRYGKTASD